LKKIILLITILIFLSGCGIIYNLNNFNIPDDIYFINVIDNLDTPEKICQYMEDNFNCQFNFFAFSPYQMWLANIKNKAGDCNDYSCFAVFCADWHGYGTYQINITFKNENYTHFLAVYVENGKYNYSSNWFYFPIQANNFKEIVEHHCWKNNRKWIFYGVYNYRMEIIEKGKY